jgi:hypothetical protein
MANLAYSRRDPIANLPEESPPEPKAEPGYRRHQIDRDWMAEFAEEPSLLDRKALRSAPEKREVVANIAPTVERQPTDSHALFGPPPRWRAGVAAAAVFAVALSAGIVATSAAFRARQAPAAADITPVAAPAPQVSAESSRPSTTPTPQPLVAPATGRKPPALADRPPTKAASVPPRPKTPAVAAPAIATLPKTPDLSLAPVAVPTNPSSALTEPVRGAVIPAPPPPAPPPPVPERRIEASPARVTTAPSPREVETAAVRGVLERYRNAFNSLSVAGIRGFWPDANDRALTRAFDLLQSQHFDFDSCAVELYLLTDSATARCTGRATFVPKVGGRSERIERRAWSFRLSRQQDRWIIVSVDSR